MNIDLDIAQVKIRIEERDGYPAHAWPLTPFDRFLAGSEPQPDITLTVTVVPTLPDYPTGRLRFDACHGLWRLYDSLQGFVLDSLDTSTHHPRIRALIRDDYASVEVWTLPHVIDGKTGWVPMHVLNPIAEVCLVTQLARRLGLPMHAAGIRTERGGYVFAGQSGAGKSTISTIFAGHGATILSDERVIVRRQDEHIVVHGTPWVGSGAYASRDSAVLTGLCCIRHGTEHRLEAMPPASFLSFLIPQCFLPYWDRAAMESTLAFLSDLVGQVPYRSLAFAKNAGVVDVVEQELAKTALVGS